MTARRSYRKNRWQWGSRSARRRDRALGTSSRLLDRGALSRRETAMFRALAGTQQRRTGELIVVRRNKGEACGSGLSPPRPAARTARQAHSLEGLALGALTGQHTLPGAEPTGPGMSGQLCWLPWPPELLHATRVGQVRLSVGAHGTSALSQSHQGCGRLSRRQQATNT